MIGLSLIAEGFGFHIPKGYLYAAIGFSVLIELFNQIARRNFIKHQSDRPLRERTAEAIFRMMGGKRDSDVQQEDAHDTAEPKQETFAEEERFMISGVLTLASRTLRSIMTPRNDISWVDCERSPDEIRRQLLDTPHSLFPICRQSLDDVIGVVRAKDLLVALENGEDIVAFAEKTPPIVVPETMDVIKLLAVLRRAKGRLVVVSNEFGVIQGLVTPLDVLEAIAGEFPDEDETPDVVVDGDGWMAKGGTDLHSLEQLLNTYELVSPNADYATLAGLLLSESGQMPFEGEVIEMPPLRFEVIEVSEYRIERVRITKISSNEMRDEEE
jgi:CBS domain containing-hemolysin-like protein